jgi:S-adenosyl-L-methionine hydrolase (adenosine-forming)
VCALRINARRAVARRSAAGPLLVGPDNGLLMLAAEWLGGAIEAFDIGHSPERLEPVSATFHGRDIFAPVAAALADGAPLAGLGEPLAVEELCGLELSVAQPLDGALLTHVLRSDHFGNLVLDASHEQLRAAGMRLGEALTVEVAGSGDGGSEIAGSAGEVHPARYASTFADVAPGELLLYEDAQLMVALAVNRGSAAALLAVARERELLVKRA